MNLVPHGILLQVTVWLINFQHGFRLCSGGEPGYLDFDNLPETNFSCRGKVIGGYYADVETGCQMFHVCTIGQKEETMDIKFLCLNGTVFDQETRVCERVDEVDCSKSERFYNLNLELYGNNAVTLSLHEVPEDEGDATESIDDQQHSTTPHPTTSTTTTTTQRPTNPPATVTTTIYHQQNNGYSQHYQPSYSTPQTSESKSLYDEKNSGYHHQYIFHNGEQANNQATSFQLFSNQGVSSTTNQPQIHQARYGTTSTPQIILNGPSTVPPLYHGISSTIQTLLNSNANNPSFINPLFHNHGIPSTTEHYTVHSNNPRETQEYHDDGEQNEEHNRRPLEAVQSTNQGKVSKLSISPVPEDSEDDEDESVQESTQSSESSKLSTGFLPTQTTPEPTARSFYPTPRSSPKPESGPTHITRHIHLSPQQPIPQLKPQQITINLPPPDIQRIVQNPSPLLPSQSRVIVTAKASVSDESGRPLNTSELVVLPLPTIPASYDDYKEGDESFDPFYRDVPKIRRSRSADEMRDLNAQAEKVIASQYRQQALRRLKRAVLDDQSDYEDDEELAHDYEYPGSDDSLENDDDVRPLFTDSEEAKAFETIKANFKQFKALLLGRRMSAEGSSEAKPAADSSPREEEDELMLSEKEEGDSRDLDKNEKMNDEIKTVMGKEAGVQNATASSSSGQNTTDAVPCIEELSNKDGSQQGGKIESMKTENDSVKDAQTKSVSTTVDSDAEEYVKPESMSNTKESDDEYKSVPTAKEAEVEKPLDTKINAKESDSKEYVSSKSPGRTEEPIKDDEKSPHKRVSKKPNAAENVEYKSPAIPEATISNSDAEKPSNEEKETSETTTEKMEDEHQESTTSQNHGEENIEGGDGSPKTVSHGVNSDEKVITESKTEKTDAVSDLEKGEASKDYKPKVGVTEPPVICETPESTPVGPHAAAELIKPENMRLYEVVVDERPEVKEKSTDHATDKNPDSLVEKVESVTEMEDSTMKKAAKKPIKSKDIVDPKLSKVDEEKSTSTVKYGASGWKPHKGKTASKTETNKSVHVIASPKPTSQLCEEAKINADKEEGEPHIAEDEQPQGDVEKPKKSSQEINADQEYLNDGQISDSKKVKEEENPESPNKIPTDASGCVDKSEDETEPSLEDSKGEYDDYESEEYFSRSRESEPYETSSEEIGSQEPTSEDTESEGYVSGEDYTSSQEDYASLSGETSSTEDSKSIVSYEDYSTEGVLKFTDEIPEAGKKNSKQKNRAVTRTSVSSEDYVDDNYEPEHYKESSAEKNSTIHQSSDGKEDKSDGKEIHEEISSTVSGSSDAKEDQANEKETSAEKSSTILDSSDEEKDEANEKKISEEKEELSFEKPLKSKVKPKTSEEKEEQSIEKKTSEEMEEKSNDKTFEGESSSLVESSDDREESSNEEGSPEGEGSALVDFGDEKKEKLKDEEISTVVDSSDEREEKPNDEAVEEDSTTTPTTTTTTPRPTTPRPTPPSLFRPFSVRKNYKYIPPTTTPNPVVIKHRFGLLNPRPAKPRKTYNELAPRPVIRKSPLLARKPFGTESTTETLTVLQRRIDDFEDSSEIIWTSTEYVDEEEKPRENKLTRSTNDISFNDTNEFSGSGESEDVVAVDEANSYGNSQAQNIEDSGSDATHPTHPTQHNPTTTAAYLSTPYPLLKATTSKNLVIEDVDAGKIANEKVEGQSHKPEEDEPRFWENEGSTELPTSQMVDGKPVEDDENHEEEASEIPNVPFSCIDREPYRFYGDSRDCRLFHYCSPGFTSKQMLDFRFVCEDTTMFDEESQSCRKDVENPKCANRQW